MTALSTVPDPTTGRVLVLEDGQVVGDVLPEEVEALLRQAEAEARRCLPCGGTGADPYALGLCRDCGGTGERL